MACDFDLRLAVGGPHAANVLGLRCAERPPALLTSFWYIKEFEKVVQAGGQFRDWVMDSGAFSALHSGATIDLQEYIDECKNRLANDEKLIEVFALDVIGDWKASLRNTEEMWRQGVEAIPCYHVGEPVHALKSMAEQYPKIAIGGAVGLNASKKLHWAEQCFAAIWPKRIHGFGFGGRKAVLALPWASVDATNWEIRPTRFGHWKSRGKLSVRGGTQDLRCEVDWYLDLEAQARHKWKKAREDL